MAGISGFLALYIGMHLRYQSGDLPMLLLLIAIMSAVAWARLSLKRHTLKELLSGTILGFGVLFILLSK
jgi:membrane-associated phospholipid phosphatase